MTGASRTVVAFGTYDGAKNPRVGVIIDGLRAAGCDVVVCSIPVGFDSKRRTAMLRRPWLLFSFALRLLTTWIGLWRRAASYRHADLVVVGWMGHLDVHLAKIRFRRATVVLDHLTSLSETAADRRVNSHIVRRVLSLLDRLAVSRADVVCVDTTEHMDDLPPYVRPKAVVVPVGAGAEWFRPPVADTGRAVRVIFFGQYTPLHGAPVIARAMRSLASADVEFTMVGDGQDLDAARAACGEAANVDWIPWLTPDELMRTVHQHDVCLGIFGTTAKALRVVPNKIFQGAAAGAAIVTSDTPPQRRAFDDAAVYVPPGDHVALARALNELADDRARLSAMRRAAYERAETCFRPASVVGPLVARLGLP